jgi:hypothetical protein
VFGQYVDSRIVVSGADTVRIAAHVARDKWTLGLDAAVWQYFVAIGLRFGWNGWRRGRFCVVRQQH